MSIEENIKYTLRCLEEENNIEILIAVESGSRAWGFPSPDSDYDCRFIYKHNRDYYLSLDEGKDYIELPVDEIYDVNGWDIKKVLKAVRKNNPTIFEWIQSPIIYKEVDGFKEELLKISNEYYDNVPVLYHYVSTAKNKINTLSEEQGKLKTYFYILRPLLACKWTMKNKDIPPMEFYKLIEDCDIPEEVMVEINKLLEQKKYAKENEKIAMNIVVLNYCKDIIFLVDEYLKNNRKKYDKNSDVLNKSFRKFLGE